MSERPKYAVRYVAYKQHVLMELINGEYHDIATFHHVTTADRVAELLEGQP